MQKSKVDYIINMKENQEALLKTIFKKCSRDTFTKNINNDNIEIKHFNLPDGTHIYNVKGDNLTRLISPKELPNITYTNPNHLKFWKKTLLQDANLSNIDGAFIKVDTKGVHYMMFDNGSLLCKFGYNHDLSKPSKIQTYLCFENNNNDFRFLPTEPSTTVLKLFEKIYTNLKSKELINTNFSKIDEMIVTLTAIENSELDKLHIVDTSNEVITPTSTEEVITPTSTEEVPVIAISEITVTPDNTITTSEITAIPVELPVIDKSFQTESTVDSQTEEIPAIDYTRKREPSIFGKIKSAIQNKFNKKSPENERDYE